MNTQNVYHISVEGKTYSFNSIDAMLEKWKSLKGIHVELYTKTIELKKEASHVPAEENL